MVDFVTFLKVVLLCCAIIVTLAIMHIAWGII
jgi:hypothetical protein